ncbi:MAG: IS21 family transposase [Elusimicrobiota bacterium]
MLDKVTRTAILTLGQKGCKIREIARALKVSRNSVKTVLREGAAEPGGAERASQLDEHLEEIRELHAKCRDQKGRTNMLRVLEELKKKLESEGKALTASYSTLTWFCREQGIGVRPKVAAARIVTEPGEEMQHDTSPYTLALGGHKTKLQCATVVLGYSRMIYMQFYPRFQRFHMKIFLTEAFQYFGGACRRCVIDNTSIAIACGSGSRAQMAPEVEAFEERFGFRFLAHEIMHSDRKGKVERPYDFIERNFLVGRKFADLADLNSQALEWIEYANRRRKRELKASPVELFAAEKALLSGLPLHVPEVYRIWQRTVDAYGCVCVDEQKYPVAADFIGKTVIVRETKDRIVVLDGHREIADHKKRLPGEAPVLPSVHAPRRQKTAQLAEEEKLKAMGAGVRAYLAALKKERGARYIWSVRKLHRLLCQYKAEDLTAAVAKAAEHRLFDVARIETILLQDIAARDYYLPLEAAAEDYEKSPQYQAGAATAEPDLNTYALTENDDDRRDP